MAVKRKNPSLAHRIPGRMRIKLPAGLDDVELKGLLQDLQVSPDVKRADMRGNSLIIEHNEDEIALTRIGVCLSKAFPGFERWSDEFDTQVARTLADPWLNKGIPVIFLGVAIYRGIISGALFAGESAFAMAYVGFDLYWKFQQENVMRKIESGLSRRKKEELEHEMQ